MCLCSSPVVMEVQSKDERLKLPVSRHHQQVCSVRQRAAACVKEGRFVTQADSMRNVFIALLKRNTFPLLVMPRHIFAVS